VTRALAGVSNSRNLVATAGVQEGKTGPDRHRESGWARMGGYRCPDTAKEKEERGKRKRMMRAASLGDFFFAPRTELPGDACINSACIEIENRK